MSSWVCRRFRRRPGRMPIAVRPEVRPEVNHRHDGDGWTAVGWRRRLRLRLLGGGHDERLTRQRLEIGNQRMRSHDLIQIDVYRHGQRGRARWNIDHLPGKNFPELLRALLQRNPRAAFERDQLAAPAAASLKDHRRSGYGDGNGAAPDGAAAGILRHAQQDRPGIDIRGPARFAEAEDRVRAQPRDGEVGKGQLGPRIAARAHPGILGYLVIHRRLARGRIGRQQFNFTNDLGDARFFRTRPVGRTGQKKRNARDGTDLDFRGDFNMANLWFGLTRE